MQKIVTSWAEEDEYKFCKDKKEYFIVIEKTNNIVILGDISM